MKKEFQSTHSLRSATPAFPPYSGPYEVSIHALLAECDHSLSCLWYREICFNPRTPCGVRRVGFSVTHFIKWFQSTHSLRSATLVRKVMYCAMSVSIHALLAECDWPSGPRVSKRPRFNPRTPCGVRPGSQQLNKLKICFNPRTPCGVRLEFLDKGLAVMEFQSTHSLRSATVSLYTFFMEHEVSIHALLAECDSWRCDTGT